MSTKRTEPKEPVVPVVEIIEDDEPPFITALRKQVQMTVLNASHGTKNPIVEVVDLSADEPAKPAKEPKEKKTGS